MTQLPIQLDFSFTAPIVTLKGPDWIVVLVPDSKHLLGTGNSVRVNGTVDGHPITAALMPTGEGGHFVSLNAKLRKALGKDVGDEVSVHLEQRLT